ncbi:hypothetical protein [Salipiger sp.]|uniref:hypothetical protein n=1 Tax=Salipiger sp. TaxID=2078585 RepID=UPI003A98834B
MRIAVTDFKGVAPKRNARLLPDQFAQTAVNTRLDDGAIGPANAPVLEEALGAPAATIYRLEDETWLTWPSVVNVVPGPIAADRLYTTGGGVPRLIVDETTYNLAVPRPTTAPTTVLQSGTVNAETSEQVLFAYTWLTEYEEESEPSPLSTPLEWSAGCVVRLSDIPAPPAGRAIDRVRIYRSSTSATGISDLYYVDEIALATTYDHDADLAPLQDVAVSKDFTAPVDTLAGIISMPNGMMAAFSGRTIYFCEPYLPHTWPAKYSLVVDFDIVALAAFGSFLAILTEGTPYRAQGTHPDNMSMEQIEENLPCVSLRSVVDFGYAAIYASTEGLVRITSTGAEVISRPLISRAQWEAVDPASIVASRYNGRYWFSFGGTLNGRTDKGAMIDLTGEQPFLIETNAHAIGAFHDIREGRLFYLFNSTTIQEWEPEGGDPMIQSWRSKVFVTPHPVNFSAIMVEGIANVDPGTFSADIYADGDLKHTITAMNVAERLPSGFRATRWEVEVTTDATIEAITIAESMGELQTP